MGAELDCLTCIEWIFFFFFFSYRYVIGLGKTKSVQILVAVPNQHAAWIVGEECFRGTSGHACSVL